MKPNSKSIGRTGAALAFLAFITGGLLLLTIALGQPFEDRIIPIAVGLYFIGKAFVSGTQLWLATEQVCGSTPEREGRLQAAPIRPWSLRIPLTISCVVIGTLLVIFLARTLHEPSRLSQQTATPYEPRQMDHSLRTQP